MRFAMTELLAETKEQIFCALGKAAEARHGSGMLSSGQFPSSPDRDRLFAFIIA
jgi:hypothetical protein